MEIIVNGLKAFKEYKKNHRWYVDFECVCGKIGTTQRKHFLNQHTKSCGCRRAKIHNKKTTPLLPRTDIGNVLYNMYVRDANTRGREFTINKKSFLKLVKLPCNYCGLEPQNKCSHRGETILYNGLDRINNDLDYHLKNVVPCCKYCNMGKSKLTKEEFLEWVNRVHNFNYGPTINSVNSVNILVEDNTEPSFKLNA